MDMKQIKLSKITLNIGCGNDQAKLDKALKLLREISKAQPVKTFTKKRLPEFGLRPGLPIGCKVTLRKNTAKELLIRLLEAKENNLDKEFFDNEGNFSFGINEYIDIPGIKYAPEIGILGLDVCVSLERAGYRIKRRRRIKRKIGKKHKIKKEEAIDFMKKEFKIEVE